ncbi:hypothetical protein CSC15_2478 [Escherichia coli]|nr:hypothetical protein CSC15_2478 [Escherichia coli]
MFCIATGNNAITSQRERLFTGKTYIVTILNINYSNFTEFIIHVFLPIQARLMSLLRRLQDDYWRGVRRSNFGQFR